jgi:DNA-binding PadR family transcriptional regulator
MSKADLIVLGFLNHKPMHGYEIVQWLKIHHLDSWVEVKLPSVYKSLQRLAKQDYIKGEFEFDGNKPPRTVYQLSDKGKIRFRKLLKQFLTTENSSSRDFWAAIAMMKKGIKKSEFLKMLEKRIHHVQTYYENFLQEIHEVNEKCKEKHIPYYDIELMTMGKRMVEAEIEALKNVQEQTILSENNQYFLDEESK